MGYFPVRYDSRAVNYDRRGFIRLATGSKHILHLQAPKCIVTVSKPLPATFYHFCPHNTSVDIKYSKN